MGEDAPADLPRLRDARRWELDRTGGVFTEQVIRPTGLVDPVVEVRPVTGDKSNQVDDVIAECKAVAKKGGRVLVTTLTKRMAEDLTEYMHEQGVKVRYMHSDIDTLERIEIIRDLRLGAFDVLVGINLLREGLDIPSASSSPSSTRTRKASCAPKPGLDEGEALSFLFENFSSVMNHENLEARLRLFNTELEARKR